MSNINEEKEFPSVSIIIPTVERPDGILPYVIRRISLLDYPNDRAEIILVNNSGSVRSDCGSAQDIGMAKGGNLLSQLPFSHKYLIENKKGRSAARNRGIREASGEYILFLDDDVIPEEGLLREHILMHGKYPGGIVLGELLPAPGTSLLDAIHLQETFGGQGHEEILEYGAVTCNLSLRRESVIEAGLFDEEFDSYGFEDIELGYRLVNNLGLKLRYNRNARGWHYRLLGKDEAVENYFQAGASLIRFLRKHPDAIANAQNPVISRHLDDTLKKASRFRPLQAREARDQLRTISDLERRYGIEPSKEAEEKLKERYRFVLDYSYLEGAFLKVRSLYNLKSPLLGSSSNGKHRSLSCAYKGLFSYNNGFGIAARMYVQALRDLGFGVMTEELNLSGIKPEAPARDHPCHLFFHHHWEPAISIPAGPYRIQVTAFETTRLPASWVKPYDRMDEIWVPSAFCKETLLNSGIRARISVIPYGVDIRNFRPTTFEKKYSPGDCFCFMSIVELWEYKGVDLLLKAYLQEFTRDDDVLLIIKMRNNPRIPGLFLKERTKGIVEPIKRSIGKKRFPLLYFYYDDLVADDLADFLNSCDSYVCASRGEGFCIPLIEAMSLGKAIISTGFGGQMDFLSKDNSYLVDYRIVPAHSAMHPWHRQGSWAEPSVSHLGCLMRRVYEKGEERETKASEGMKDVARSWSAASMRNKMAERLYEIYEENGSSIENIFLDRYKIL